MLPPADELQLQLLRRIAAEDREALAELYDQLSGSLFAVSFRILGDSHEAEEVIQDVFVQIWDKARIFEPIMGAPLSWALSITRNRSIDRLRSRQRRARVQDELEKIHETEARTPAPEDPALGGDEVTAIRSAVHTLPFEQRQAIEMAFFGGKTHLEIAEALQEPLGTVKARIRRGMLKLRESLQAYA